MTPQLPLQKLLFSATMTLNPELLASLSLHLPKLFTVGAARGAGLGEDITFTLPMELEECTVQCPLPHKPLVLLHLLLSLHLSRVLCFTNSRDSTHR